MYLYMCAHVCVHILTTIECLCDFIDLFIFRILLAVAKGCFTLLSCYAIRQLLHGRQKRPSLVDLYLRADVWVNQTMSGELPGGSLGNNI